MVALKISPKINIVEANALAKFCHPNIVQVFSVSQLQWNGKSLFGICMQFVPGRSLREILSAHDQGIHVTPSPREFVLCLGKDIATALSYAHAHQLLHLDVKPENILYDGQGHFLLADFNVAMEKDQIDMARVGGSWNYMPPEQLALFEGRPSSGKGPCLTERSDLYSLGRVLADVARVMGVELQPQIQAIVSKSTQHEPENRFTSADQLLGSITLHLDLMQSQLGTPDKLNSRGSFQLWALKHPWKAIVGSILIPNIFSSILQVQYNALYILAALSPMQRDRFQSMLFPVNGLLYAVAAYLIWLYFSPVVRGLKSSTSDQESLSSALPSIGRGIRFMSLFSILIWGGGFAAFTTCLGQPPLTATQWMHFAISFAIALSVSLSLARLLITYLGFAVFYPSILQKMVEIKSLDDLPNIRGLKYSSGIISMVGILIVILSGASQIDYPVQVLVVTFTLGATVSFILGSEIAGRIHSSWEVLNRLTSRTASKK